MDIEGKEQAALCGGRPYTRSSVSHGASPYVTLTADRVTGPFLLDYGATRSSLSATAFPGPDRSIRKTAISLPGIESADFHLARYDLLLQPDKGQLGVIGDDLLSRFTVQLTESTAYLGGESCRPEALVARGLTPVAQNGFFSSDPLQDRRRAAQCSRCLFAPGRRPRLGANRHWLRGRRLPPLGRHQPSAVRQFHPKWNSRSIGLRTSTCGRARAARAGLCIGSRTTP